MSVLTDIFAEVSQGTYYNNLINAHKLNGVPVDSWLSSVNIGISFTQIFSENLANLRNYISLLAKSSFLETAATLTDSEGLEIRDALTLLAKSQYQIDRNAAQFSQLNVRLVSTAGAPSYFFLPGQITIGTQGPPSLQKTYTNITGGILNPSGFIDLVFSANNPGASYNIPNTTTLDMKTSFVGVSVSNPIYPPASSCILRQGSDEETNASLYARCLGRWGTLGTGGNEDAFIYWARSIPPGYVTSPVQKVRIAPNFQNGIFWPGVCTVYIAGATGALPIADVNAVQGVFDNPPKYPIAGSVIVDTVTNINVSVIGIVNVKITSGFTLTEIQTLVEASLLDYQNTLNIGETVYPQKIGARIEDANKLAIRDVVLSSPSGPVYLNFNEFPILQYTGGNLAYVYV